MWTATELENIENLLDPNVELKHFLNKDEIDVIKGDDGDGYLSNLVRFKNLRNAVFAPKHSPKFPV